MDGGRGLQNLYLQSFSHNFKNSVRNWHLKALCEIFVLEFLTGLLKKVRSFTYNICVRVSLKSSKMKVVNP
jgi:hypothetical protein